ncbi:D-2-hydroxyacid dehydrogenase [Anaerocolumna chitinilytica]|uniref:2-hydroxyacid dehydrogenase n=1 Tax=Anaerocolumna chitinilytica TaxID=1727145 RepID=A0A7I8DTN2_9FIRM|nr:D-2-hydroxyacid dehydrogenase [Anaerocolumna chitinilytica]BCK00396.1 2-hydroxyacid dehydrogenase [Anaerocolumna chitinilytica]
MKIVFLETDSLGSDVDLSGFETLGEVIKYNKSEPAVNAERIKEADILVVNKIPMNEASLKDAADLKLICITGTGTNIVDFPYINIRKIAVANVKGYSTASVAQHTFALLFYLYEKLYHYDTFVKSGGYVKSDIFSCFDEKFNELEGKTWGIIGFGDIGKRVANIAGAFGCNIIYYSTSGRNQNNDYKRVDFDTLLKDSDIISIHAPLNSDTENLINEEALGKMKSTAFLLNLGRGPIVDETALYKALTEGWIAGAGLDVLRQEPMAADNPLLAIKDSRKLIITPHIAWATVEARRRCVKEVYENMTAFLRGEERNIVVK